MSIIEVLFAIGVVATGLLGLMSVFVAGQRASNFGANVSIATGYCRDILEIVRSRGLVFHYGDANGFPNLPPASSGLNDAAATRRNLNTTPPIDFSEIAEENVGHRTQFRRNITTERLTNSPSDYQASMFRVTVKVYWFERGVEKDVKLVAIARQPR